MKKLVSKFEMDVLTYFLIRACLIGITANNILLLAKQDSPLSIFVGIILGFIPLYIYLYIINYKPNLSIVELNEELFGKKLGIIINLILAFFVFFFATIVFFDLSNFINSQYLSLTPTFVIGLLFGSVVFYMLAKGLKVFARTIVILFYMEFFLYLLSFVGLIGQVDLNNLKPSLIQGMEPIMTGAFQYISYNVLPLFILTIIPKNNISLNRNYNMHVIRTYLVASFVSFTVIFCTVTIFGVELSLLYQYAEYHLLKRVSLIGFIQRVESTLSLQWIFDLLVMISFCLYFTTNAIKRTFKIHSGKTNTIIQFVTIVSCVLLSNYIFANDTFSSNFLLNVFPFFLYAIFFVLPLIIVLRIYFSGKKETEKLSDEILLSRT